MWPCVGPGTTTLCRLGAGRISCRFMALPKLAMINIFTMRHSIPRQSRIHYFHSEGETMEEQVLPTVAKVVMVAKVSTWLMLTGIREMVPIPKHKSNSWQTKMEQTTLGTKWNLQIKCTRSMDKIWEAIQAEKAIVVLDISFQNDTGACAWIIECLSSENCVKGLMETPGSSGDIAPSKARQQGNTDYCWLSIIC